MNLVKVLLCGGMFGGWSYFVFLWWVASGNPLGRVVLLTDVFGENLFEMVLFGVCALACLFMALEEIFKKEASE